MLSNGCPRPLLPLQIVMLLVFAIIAAPPLSSEIEQLLSFPDSSRLLLPWGRVIDIDAKFDVKLPDVKEHCAHFEILLYFWRERQCQISYSTFKFEA